MAQVAHLKAAMSGTGQKAVDSQPQPSTSGRAPHSTASESTKSSNAAGLTSSRVEDRSVVVE